MDFFYSQQSLTAVQWILRAVVAFFFLLVVVKIMGRHSISKLRMIDFTMALLLGNIISDPLSDERLEMRGSLITISVLVILYSISVFLTLKWHKLRNWLDPSPFPLIKNGQIIYKNLSKAKISLNFLLSQLRKEKVTAVQKVALALWEPDGNISVFLEPKHESVTRADMQLPATSFSFPYPIIKDGQIDNSELKKIGKDWEWLEHKLKEDHHITVNEVLLATLDQSEQLKVLLYR
ncbi:DUF421 domain-containing protein [Pseudobacillus wudalianchiensis]|uniref:DUF421 domain-containing protein n=1 Tax=Pseudobacillus wudalianchiensis TaxID=1743143 RepID=A0A1B9B8C6_9BACI|nr:DUF421 domain-containing protein [Bacillus wudalianchiensis]OCA92337.1 hypothetical protein A8F95_01035 [Bacillus wudalianchiensis]